MPRKKSGGSANPAYTINISTATILKVLIVTIGVLFVFFLRDIVAILLISLLLAVLIDPFADYLAKFRIGRGFSVGIIYLILGFLTSLAFIFIVPRIVDESRTLFTRHEETLQILLSQSQIAGGINPEFLLERDGLSVVEAVQNSGIIDAFPVVLSFISDTFGGILTTIFVLVLAFYLVVEEKNLRKGAGFFVSKKYRPIIKDILPKARKKIGQWLRGQVLIMISVFIVTYVILEFVLDLPFALILALFAAILEILPYIGPVIAAIPAILIALSISPILGLFTALSYFGIQQFEGQILTPKIMQKVTGLNPVFSLLALLIGLKLAGVIGGILAIPFAVILSVFFEEFMKKADEISL